MNALFECSLALKNAKMQFSNNGFVRMKEIWDHYSAMRWAICSPPLLDVHNHPTTGLWPSMQWFGELWEGADIVPGDLSIVGHSDDPSLPIGRYFESLVCAFFERHPDFVVVARNVVMVSEGRTIGECDLVVQSNLTKEFFHIELGCKYYLSAENRGDWSTWKGRNTQDTLQLKWDKLQQQLHLFELPVGRAWLEERGISRIQPMCLLKGYAFVPQRSLDRARLPKWHHPRQHVGWYLNLHEWPLEKNEIRQWILLPKAWWLVFPVVAFAEIADRLMDNRSLYEQLVVLFKSKKHRGWLVAQVMDQDGKALELSRGMVVDPTWPMT
jgi:uncharacterized protein